MLEPKKYLKTFTDPRWYLTLEPELNEYFWSYQGHDKEQKPKEWLEKRKEFVLLVSELLEANEIALGKTGENWDKEQLPIDTVVIHHTGNEPGVSWRELSAIQLVRLYASYYAHPYLPNERHITGGPLWSGHFRDHQQVFYVYHWLVRMDGSSERLLKDQEIGWHAGNWNVNCRSIAVCLDNDFENTSPPDEVLASTAKLIQGYGENMTILGHCEVNPKSTSPGKTFLSEWKPKLLHLIDQ